MLVSVELVLLYYNQTQWSETHQMVIFPNNLRPIAYASKTLSQTESNYSNIERELLGVVFSCLHFKHFAYGCKVTVHKPLVSLFKKSLGSSSPRLARMLLQILNFDLDVVYQPGSQMHLSDAISRLSSHYPDKGDTILGLDVSIHDVSVCTGFNATPLQDHSRNILRKMTLSIFYLTTYIKAFLLVSKRCLIVLNLTLLSEMN